MTGTKKPRRKPLPYAFKGCLEDALDANDDAIRALLPIAQGKTTGAPEVYQRVAQAVHCIHEAISHLKEIKIEERQDA
jgi:hypothetical protein